MAADPAHAIAGKQPEIRVLRPEQVAALRPRGNRLTTVPAIRSLIESYPGRSVWVPTTLEYVLMAPWRHRDEIAVVHDLVAIGHAEALLVAAIACCRAAGAAMMIMVELDEVRRPMFYARAGLSQIEEVITFELDRPWAISYPTFTLSFEPVRPGDLPAMAALLAIDHAAFPWLWWNSPGEFAAYLDTPGAQLYLGWQEGQPIAYVGVTAYSEWGHLDRVAVLPTSQGHGFGQQALAFAIERLVVSGARRVGLSTQQLNHRSQRLYERFGFRRSPDYDYRLYGTVLRTPSDHEEVVN